ncbi:metallophosphoesterase [Candidatus Woesearchaeota archaeon]|nr:metallophosphoesterase [Candidatus Woesearchaeota archaeon]
MKFLTFTDIHQDREMLACLVERAAKPDIDFVLCAGDISTFGRGLQVVLKAFNDLEKPFYVIPGNHEEGGALLSSAVEFYPYCVNLDRKALELDGFVLLGYGGGGFAQEDAVFRAVAREWYSLYNGRKIIFFTHGPPFGLKVDYLYDRHVGNKDYRKFIERINPKVVVCGHLHETAGVIEKLGHSIILNPGPKGKVIEVK